MKVVDKAVKENEITVLAEVKFEFLEKEAGKLNKHLRKNDVKHTLYGNISVAYTKFEKGWRFNRIENPNALKHEQEEIERLFKIIPFDKNEESILNELKQGNIGVFIFNNIMATVTFGSNSKAGYRTIKETNDFIIKDVKQKSEIYSDVTIYIDVNFDINDINNLYEQNGTYNAKGTFVIRYKLDEDSNGNSYWKLIGTNDLLSKFNITKI